MDSRCFNSLFGHVWACLTMPSPKKKKNKKKKNYSFREMQVARKIFNQAAANFIFFNRFSGDTLFSSLVSFAFFDFYFYLFDWLMFFDIKNVYCNTLDYAGGWVIKKTPGPFPETRILFLALPKITLSICSFNIYVPACKKNQLHNTNSFWDMKV